MLDVSTAFGFERSHLSFNAAHVILGPWNHPGAFKHRGGEPQYFRLRATE